MLVFGAIEESVVIELIKLYRISYPYVIDKKRSLLKENESLSNKNIIRLLWIPIEKFLVKFPYLFGENMEIVYTNVR